MKLLRFLLIAICIGMACQSAYSIDEPQDDRIAFYQDEPQDDGDTGVITDGPAEEESSGLPGWLTEAIALIIAIIPTVAWGKAKYRLGKFAALASVISTVIADKVVTNSEVQDVARALKELAAKEGA